jgi:hypothetical protein
MAPDTRFPAGMTSVPVHLKKLTNAGKIKEHRGVSFEFAGIPAICSHSSCKQ